MHTFIVSSDHVFQYNQSTYVLGLPLDMGVGVLREKIERYFPTLQDLAEGYRLETMLMVPVQTKHTDVTTLSYLPLCSLSFQAKTGKERYVLLEKRDPVTKNVIFKDDDTFFEDDPKLDDIKNQLIQELITNYQFYTQHFKATQDLS